MDGGAVKGHRARRIARRLHDDSLESRDNRLKRDIEIGRTSVRKHGDRVARDMSNRTDADGERARLETAKYECAANVGDRGRRMPHDFDARSADA